jgi:hypothetical protein
VRIDAAVIERLRRMAAEIELGCAMAEKSAPGPVPVNAGAFGATANALGPGSAPVAGILGALPEVADLRTRALALARADAKFLRTLSDALAWEFPPRCGVPFPTDGPENHCTLPPKHAGAHHNGRWNRCYARHLIADGVRGLCTLPTRHDGPHRDHTRPTE